MNLPEMVHHALVMASEGCGKWKNGNGCDFGRFDGELIKLNFKCI